MGEAALRERRPDDARRRFDEALVWNAADLRGQRGLGASCLAQDNLAPASPAVAYSFQKNIYPEDARQFVCKSTRALIALMAAIALLPNSSSLTTRFKASTVFASPIRPSTLMI